MESFKRATLARFKQTCIEILSRIMERSDSNPAPPLIQWIGAAIIISSPLYEAASTHDLADIFGSLLGEWTDTENSVQ
ncbi:hypothetical protein AWB76_06746 [Caballeronia temeraria]|uniref:TetR family transcriptional regulator n=1 Tax=Caballeronia temeraria TaxID=1777137 RepID=A0A158DC03_9BURK|nr:hypothetical protein AWB76_06746 [Caballeronia temeraria]